ncbi:MAG: hypothetical protein ACLQIB_48980 [Isosphaeraceae bacterium]
MTQGSADAAASVFKQVVALQPQDRLSAQLLDFLSRKPEADGAQTQGAAAQPGDSRLAQSQPAQPATAPQTAQAANGQAQALASGAATPGAAGGENPLPPPLPTDPVPAGLIGTWTASPAKDVTIALALDQKKGFSWKVTDRGQAREFRGQATFDNNTNTLALVPPDQPPMVGTLRRSDDGHLVFKAMGAPANDPGLTFGKS